MSDITRSEAIKILKEHLSHWERLLQEHICEEQEGIDTISALKLAIASLETDEAYQLEYESTTKNDLGVDVISRQAVIDSLYDWSNHSMTDAETWHLRQVIGDIKSMPSVTPQEPKTGHWIPIYQGDEIIDYRCSECEFGNTFGKGPFGMNFCPRCGSDNRDVEE